VAAALIDEGALGQKTRAASTRRSASDIQVLDPATGGLSPPDGKADEAWSRSSRTGSGGAFAQLRASQHPQAQFLWSIFRDTFHYCAVHLEAIAHNARDVDFAIRWGFGWERGPFEIWQSAGWQQVAGWIAEDIAAGKTMAAPAAGLGDRARAQRRARPHRLVRARRAMLPAALDAAGLSPPAFPRPPARRGAQSTARRCSRTTACAAGTPATTSRS
jgi:hypothetical protein